MTESNKNVPEIKAGDVLIMENHPAAWLCVDGKYMLGFDKNATVSDSWNVSYALDHEDCLAVYRAPKEWAEHYRFFDYEHIQRICADPLNACSEHIIYAHNSTELSRRNKIATEVGIMLSKVVSDDYHSDVYKLLKIDIIEDVIANADPIDWDEDDIRLSIGRVLLGRLNQEDED